VIVTWAVTDRNARKGKGISAFVIEKGIPGFCPGKAEDKMGHRASTTNELIFEDCFVPEQCLLGKEGEGFKIAMVELMEEGSASVLWPSGSDFLPLTLRRNMQRGVRKPHFEL
jgi:alkylation response protein AidB-like acyl-CoA dehydrogenase